MVHTSSAIDILKEQLQMLEDKQSSSFVDANGEIEDGQIIEQEPEQVA